MIMGGPALRQMNRTQAQCRPLLGWHSGMDRRVWARELGPPRPWRRFSRPRALAPPPSSGGVWAAACAWWFPAAMALPSVALPQPPPPSHRLLFPGDSRVFLQHRGPRIRAASGLGRGAGEPGRPERRAQQAAAVRAAHMDRSPRPELSKHICLHIPVSAVFQASGPLGPGIARLPCLVRVSVSDPGRHSRAPACPGRSRSDAPAVRGSCLTCGRAGQGLTRPRVAPSVSCRLVTERR